MAEVNCMLKVDESTKNAAEIVLNELGMTMTTGFNMFLEAVVRQRGIPFDLALEPTLKEIKPSHSEIANNILLAVQELRKDTYSKEEDDAIDDLQQGKYKPVFEERINR